MDTVIDLRSLDSRYQSGLIFSFFEGLLEGKAFKLIFGQNPSFIENQFTDAKITNAKMQISQIDMSTWEVNISKFNKPTTIHQSGGCCGICGSGQES
jgi:uncharacterized protein (DUF2249 family)